MTYLSVLYLELLRSYLFVFLLFYGLKQHLLFIAIYFMFIAWPADCIIFYALHSLKPIT